MALEYHRSISKHFCKAKPMSHLRFSVAVVVECVPLAHRWVSEQWRVAAIELDPRPSTPPCKVSHDADGTRWRFQGLVIELHPSESEGYYLLAGSKGFRDVAHVGDRRQRR
jgi:hypothetical protein